MVSPPPLVPVFDALLLAGSAQPRAALNLGGIANLTVVRPGKPIIGYDIGPANALLDAAAQRFHNQPCDVDGQGAARGTVDGELLATLLAEPFYRRDPPKSTGREMFHSGYVPRTEAEWGIPSQANEAYAFAVLGWLSWHGLPGSLPSECHRSHRAGRTRTMDARGHRPAPAGTGCRGTTPADPGSPGGLAPSPERM